MAGVTLSQLAEITGKAYDDAINKYLDILFNIADDIYDSCIAQYYASYPPKVYTRHGNKEGYNLYRANDIEVNNEGIVNDFDGGEPYGLLKYGTKADIREKVLKAVLSGKRGINPRPGTKRRWQKDWVASYPNDYSNPEYKQYWSSSFHTMNEIFDDFDNNILADTKDLKMKLVREYFKKYLKKYAK